MVTISGKSIVPVNQVAFGKFLNSVVPSDKVPEFNVKLDGREKVKSVFVKLEGTTLTIYTGAIAGYGSEKFAECRSNSSIVLLLILYGIKKFNQSQEFDIKSTDAAVANVKAEKLFSDTLGQLPIFESKLLEIFPDAYALTVPQPLVKEEPVVQSNTIVEKVTKPTKVAKSENAMVPLENTPKIEVPEGLDLTQV